MSTLVVLRRNLRGGVRYGVRAAPRTGTDSALLIEVLLCLVIFCVPAAAITGRVEQIGFQNTYRPDCWNPMLVSIQPEGTVGNFLLQVVQEDLDRDRVVYQRPVVLAGGTAEQRFWTCFIPQPSGGGLPDASEGVAGLQAKLKIYLADAAGKPIAQLPLTRPITDIDPPYSRTSVMKPARMILAVSDVGSGDSAPVFDYDQVRGVKENVALYSATPADLPDDCLGYEPVDAIILLNVDPVLLKSAHKFDPLRRWVREGGNLVICQNPQWQKMEGWDDLLPVTYPAFGGDGALMQGAADRDDPGPVWRWAAAPAATTQNSGPFSVAVARAKPSAFEVDGINWPSASGGNISTAYLVREVYGVGTVTWIAVDLGEPALIRADLAWPRVWQHLFGWNDDTLIFLPGNTAAQQRLNSEIESVFGLAHGIDFGTALLMQMEHAGRSASLLLIAAVFLGIYWLLAGPGGYFFLMSRREARLSWFLFAGVAAGATLLTFLVVRIVLRGPAEAHHLSVVRVSGGGGAVVRSRIGLYIPRDNPAEPVGLGGTSGDAYITPYPMHPQQMKENEFAGYMQYTVNVRDGLDEGSPLIRVPYRSTLKKLEAKWLGPGPGIEGRAPRVMPDSSLAGELTSGMGRAMQDVYFIFNDPLQYGRGDVVLYLPKWQQGDTIYLDREFAGAKSLQFMKEPRVVPGNGETIQGRIGTPHRRGDWDRWWFTGLQGGSAEQDFPGDAYSAFVMLSLFDRLPTQPNRTEAPRFEMDRRGARSMDASNIVAAGALLVLARAEGALPFPLEVGGQTVPGTGSIYYQIILPLDRSAVAIRPAAPSKRTAQ